MKGRYAGVKMGVYGAILPGVARLVRLPAEPSTEAKRRLRVVSWCEGHEGKVRLTARHFGYSPDTISRWVRAYSSGGMGGLEPKSRRPRRVRQSQTPLEVVEKIRAVREQYPRWGREKLRVLLSEEGITLSAKSIDWVIGQLKVRGVLREAVQPRKAVRWQHKRLRRPGELVVDRPGALVQMDSKHVTLGIWKGGVPVWGGGLFHQEEGGGSGATAYQSPWRRVLEAGGDPVPLPDTSHTIGGGERVPQGVRSCECRAPVAPLLQPAQLYPEPAPYWIRGQRAH